MNRYVICCAGSGTRWGNYTGVPKQLVKIDGVSLLERAVQGIVRRDKDNEIYVLAPDDPRFAVAGSSMQVPGVSTLPETAIGHSEAYWHDAALTTVLFGDVYFSDRALDLICAPRAGQVDPLWFGRYGPGKSGHRWGELFGVSLPPSGHAPMRAAMKAVLAAKERKETSRAGGWECYRHLHDIPLNTHKVDADFVEINDETDDFDIPKEYHMWIDKFRKPQKKKT